MVLNMSKLVFISICFEILVTVCSDITTTESEFTTENATDSLNETIATTLETISTTCKANTSCSVTEAPRTTTVAPDQDNDKAKLQNTSQNNIKNKICTCNLHLSYCDINCCCDEDCTEDDKILFRNCVDENRVYDTSLCDYTEYIYLNNTKVEREINQNGLFCVVRRNSPPTYTIQRKNPLKSFKEAELEKKNKYSWPQDAQSIEEQSVEIYTYGKPIWIIRNNVLEKLTIPNNFITDSCILMEDVNFLQSTKTTCSQQISGDNANLNISFYYKNIRVIAKPKLFNITTFTKKKQCPATTCTKITLKFCSLNFENCQDNSGLESEPVCKFSFSKISCQNLVQDIKYDFHHNGTNGLIKIILSAVLKNVTLNFQEPFYQSFYTNFIWVNRTLNFSSQLSGNPGYRPGKPILKANLLLFNKTTNYSRLFRNSTSFPDNFMVLPDIDSNGFCVLSKKQYLRIEFAYNLITKCRARGFLEVPKNSTAKKLCIGIQLILLKYWNLIDLNGTLANTFIGQFGNSNIHKEAEWSQILLNENLTEILNITNGKLINNKNLVCKIATKLRIDFFHTRVDLDYIIDQEKILGTTMEFEDYRNLTFVVLNNRVIDFNVLIRSEVVFFDITKPKIKKIVDPPSLKIAFPYDFFYPFVKVGGEGTRISANSILCLSIVLIKFFV